MDKTNLQLTLDTRPFASLETEALVTYIFDEPDPIRPPRRNRFFRQWLVKRIAGSGEATGKTLSLL
jgi:hypothetical protein